MISSTTLDTFRQTVRRWCRDNVPKNWEDELRGAPLDAYVDFQRDWLQRLRTGGYAAPHWPVEWGGAALRGAEKIILFEELARARAPRTSLFNIGLYHAAATLLTAGTEAQRARHLPAILDGEVWCQAFSEPAAGSDLASLRARAVRSGDGYVVNGQKTWSSMASFAKFALLLARTGSQEAKGRGISFFLLDLSTPGVEIRPIKQSTGDEEFSEIFLTDVFIPAENLVGTQDAGWGIAQVTLTEERGVLIVELAERLYFRTLDLIADLQRREEGRASIDPALRRDVATLLGRVEVVRSMSRHLVLSPRGAASDSDVSVLKLLYGDILQDVTRMGVRVLGIDQLMEPERVTGGGWETGAWFTDFVAAAAWTIAGGTNEIHRTLLATRGLGLGRAK